MKVTLESTTKVVSIDGQATRVWEGQTESGIAVIAMVAIIGAKNEQARSKFSHELSVHKKPSASANAVPAFMGY